MMKTFGITEHKPLKDVSHLRELEVPKPTAMGKDLLIKVKATATNPIDYKRMDLFNSGPFTKDNGLLTTGWDAAGVVEAVGDEATLFSVGDEVYFAGDWLRPGAFAEYTVVDERVVGKKPQSLSFSESASLPLTGLTAWEALVDKLGVSENKEKNAGKVILIVGGAGGAATACVNLAKYAFGLTVIASASRPESSAYVTEMGADHVINHRENLTEQVHALGYQEIDYVFHTADLTEALVTEFVGLLRPFGGITCISPHPIKIDVFAFFMKAISFSYELIFVRPSLKDDSTTRQHEILSKMSQLVDKRVLVHRERTTMPFNLENLKKALEMQASGKTVGKITLSMD